MPSKKLGLLIVSVVVVLAVFYVVFNFENLKNTPVVFERGGGITDGSVDYIKDTDGDGLADWEEALWKTDPQNPDTDGDGTPDGGGGDLGRDPIKKGPSDKLERNIFETPDITGSASNQQSLSETDVFMRELLLRYFALKGSGSVDNQSIEKLANSLASEISSKEILPEKTYQFVDILLSDDSNSSMRTYGESVGAIFAERSEKESELYILSQAFSGNNTGTIEKLAQFEKEYIAMIKKLLLVKAPPALASTHLGFINEFGMIASAVGAMANTLDNPILGYMGISQYQKSLNTIKEHMEYVGSVFNNQGVIFKKGESGYLFTSIFEQTQ